MAKKSVILLILSGFIILKFLLHYFLISPGYDLHSDEFLHLDQANHLAWGYLSVPPFTSWISWLIYLLGGSVFWVKFFPGLFGALTIVVVWKAVEELNGNLFALILSATCVLFSTILRINLLFQPNSFDILAWTTLSYILIKYFKTEKPKWLYMAALVLGIGFLNKYNIVFLLTGLLPAIIITQQRKIFIKKDLYFAVVVGLLVVLPNLLWQYKNDFPVFQHLRELANTQLVHIHRADFLKGQLLFYTGSLPVIITAIFALLFYKPFEKYRTFFWSIIFTLLIFTCLSAKPYYAMGLYPIYISFGAVFWGDVLQNRWKSYVKPVLIIVPILFFIRMYDFTFLNKTPEYIVNHPEKYRKYGLLRGDDGTEHLLPQDNESMIGWKVLTMKIDSICTGLPDLEHTFILCDDYEQAGAINYYTKNKKVTAHSYHTDYINWIPLDQKITDAILVKAHSFDRDRNRLKEAPLFDTVYLATQRVNRYAKEDTISVYVLKGAKVDVNEIIRGDIDVRKKRVQ